ncbi:UNVERIFIED_CONTAM: hypothetical protein GTU68_057700 [Idotea baltica]|nr:hypothetical protein [Idotea baltica]
MSLKDKIGQDLKTAMKAKDQAALRGVRAIKAGLLLMETDGSGEEITEEKEIKLLQKLVKQRQDSLTIYEEQGREDLAATEREEIEVISKYLPEQLSDDAIKTILQEVINTTGAVSMKDMGKVMGMAGQKIAGRADNKVVAGLVKELLS